MIDKKRYTEIIEINKLQRSGKKKPSQPSNPFFVVFNRVLSTHISQSRLVLYLYILNQKEDESFELSSKKILISRFPTTVIHLEKEDVSQSSLFADHCSTRNQFLNVELEYLWMMTRTHPCMLSNFLVTQLNELNHNIVIC